MAPALPPKTNTTNQNPAATASPGEREEIPSPELAHCTISNDKFQQKIMRQTLHFLCETAKEDESFHLVQMPYSIISF